MPDTLRRLVVQVTGADQSGVVDLVLPAECPLGELMPSLVDAVFGDSAPPRHWYLTHMAGPALDSSLSLRDNHIQDGDLVTLAPYPLPTPRLTPTEFSSVVAFAADRTAFPRDAVLVAGIAGVFAAAVALVWSGVVGSSVWHVWSAAALAVAAAATAVAVDRSDRETGRLAGSGAVFFATATGALAVQGAGWTASALLAAASALAMSTLLMRVTTDDGLLIAFAAAAGATLAATALCVTVTTRFDVAGTTLAVIALAGLAAAPRIAALTARLDAGAAHRVLTGLVTGWSVAAALGAALVVAGALRPGSSTTLAAAFCADVGLLLVLRQRCYADIRRRIWLAVGGVVALVSSLLVSVTAFAGQGYWVCMAFAIGCAVCVWWSGRATEPNPILRQSIQVTEYLALAAVLPLAFWLTGLYGWVRESSLS